MIRRFFLPMLATLTGVASQAQVIDFEDVPNADPFFTLHGDTVLSGGFQFASVFEVGLPEAIASWGSSMSLYTGSVAIFANYPNDVLAMTIIGGGAFDVSSIDMADALLNPINQTVTFIGTRADTTTVTNQITLTNSSSLNTYFFSGMTNIVSLTMDDTNDSAFQIDNINTAVPEPATLIALSIGMIAMRKRRSKAS